MDRLSLLLFGLFILNFITVAAFAQERCFDQRAPYFQAIGKMDAGIHEKFSALSDGCNELREFPVMIDKYSLKEKIEHNIAIFSFWTLGQAVASFSNLDGSEKQKSFMADLQKIKGHKNPMTRIQLVYELVVSHQGEYDWDEDGMRNFLSGFYFFSNTPENILNQSEKLGTGGVCRDFASLMIWALSRVQRFGKSEKSTLGPSDFTVKLLTGQVPGRGMNGWKSKDAGGHAWIRINLPVFNKLGQVRGFNYFDLDTTYYEKFAPLFPRRSGINHEQRLDLLMQCQQIKNCLAAESRR